ncbi:PHP domain-containing protein [Candidatus Woesearchaeota archaeon]|nr:PHP domain-containing protein [Candidatus Woesearchaeota archaeon]
MKKNKKQKEEYVDLHIHSTNSDGELTPTQVVEQSVKLGLKAIAITDHDSIGGVKEAMVAAKGRIEVVPGVEIRAYNLDKGFNEVDILGFFFDQDAKPIRKVLEKARTERINQKKKMVKKLQEFGYEITFEEVLAHVKGEVARPHVAQVLVDKYPEEFSSIRDVFDKILGNDKPAYVEREYFTSIKEVVDAITKSGGVALLAHPAIYKEEVMLKLIDYFIECGGKGIETLYPYAKLYAHGGFDEEKEKKTIAKLKKIAKEKDLLETGGSDFHAGDRPSAINEMRVSYSVLEKMKERSKN